MSKKRVLIVDDEIDTLKLLKMIVEISGYEAYTTLNSLEALTLAQVEQPDVILLDIMMPKMDGFQLCKMMRAHPQTSNLPVIFVTAYPALDLDDRRKACGADMILPKPIDMDHLIKAIEQVQTMERIIPADIQKASGVQPSAAITPPVAPAVSAAPVVINTPPATPNPAATALPASNGAGSEKKPETAVPSETSQAKEKPNSTNGTPK